MVGCLLLKHFGMSVDDLIFFDEKNGVPGEVSEKIMILWSNCNLSMSWIQRKNQYS
jgi:hypothetical protein